MLLSSWPAASDADVRMIEISLAASRSEYRVGDVAQVSVRLRNVSSAPRLVTGVLDGSEFGVRFPHYLPRMEGSGRPEAVPEIPDFTSPLRASDFRWLQPGEDFDPTDRSAGGAYVPIVAFQRITRAPGRYAVSLTFSTESAAPDEWLGTLPSRRDPKVLELIATVPRLTVHSNVLNFLVT